MPSHSFAPSRATLHTPVSRARPHDPTERGDEDPHLGKRDDPIGGPSVVVYAAWYGELRHRWSVDELARGREAGAWKKGGEAKETPRGELGRRRAGDVAFPCPPCYWSYDYMTEKTV